MEITLRKAVTPEETAAVSAVAKKVWNQHFTPIIGADQVAYMLEKYQSAEKIQQAVKQEGYTYLAAFYGETMIGYCGVRFDLDSLFLSKLYVMQEYRGQGVARKILNELVVMAKKRNLHSIWLTVNKHNETTIAIYKKVGFTVCDAIVTDIGSGFVMDDYMMRWQLI